MFRLHAQLLTISSVIADVCFPGSRNLNFARNQALAFVERNEQLHERTE